MEVLALPNTECEGGSWSPVCGECFIYSVWCSRINFCVGYVGRCSVWKAHGSDCEHQPTFLPSNYLGKVFLHDEALKTPMYLRLPLLSFGSTGTRLQLMARSGEDLFPPVASRWLDRSSNCC